MPDRGDLTTAIAAFAPVRRMVLEQLHSRLLISVVACTAGRTAAAKIPHFRACGSLLVTTHKSNVMCSLLANISRARRAIGRFV